MKKFLAFLFAVGICQHAICIDFHPGLSLLIGNTNTTDFASISSGNFVISHRGLNVGLEFTDKIRLNNDFFIKTGLRLNSFKTVVSAGGQLPGVSADWERVYTSFVVPVELGRDFTTTGGISGDYFAGFAAGILVMSSSTDGLSDYGNPDTIVSHSTDMNTPSSPSSFFYTLNAGADIQPFRPSPRFKIGFLYFAQLGQTQTTYLQGAALDEHTNVTANYSMQYRQRFTNFALTMTYTFGKLKSAQSKSKLSNPGLLPPSE